MSDLDIISKLNANFVETWKKRLTIYEMARIIGARSLQLAMGAIPLIDTSSLSQDQLNAISIAEEELKRGLLPITIRRRFPNGKVELVSVKEVMGS
ncbi:DNA-directed RNA polymerase subunit K [Acidianus sulfidivorans JP7]|uniref:DNA-directed RNA polymerase subunit Rpo6 n=1 Tax=Acidianus sulfidivorans JP7 TaxID=619593 RepID=A0A2U9INX6_9CREN|nr:DNA-directed RNA polymerase subunit K [Acidianus sulfidivorans]AWR97749.1 DNA-directed RNA polymerase subunit K [Acidianus sulfidivorans JP7]